MAFIILRRTLQGRIDGIDKKSGVSYYLHFWLRQHTDRSADLKPTTPKRFEQHSFSLFQLFWGERNCSMVVHRTDGAYPSRKTAFYRKSILSRRTHCGMRDVYPLVNLSIETSFPFFYIEGRQRLWLGNPHRSFTVCSFYSFERFLF